MRDDEVTKPFPRPAVRPVLDPRLPLPADVGLPPWGQRVFIGLLLCTLSALTMFGAVAFAVWMFW